MVLTVCILTQTSKARAVFSPKSDLVSRVRNLAGKVKHQSVTPELFSPVAKLLCLGAIKKIFLLYACV